MLLSVAVNAAVVKGKVVDEQSAPLAFANVALRQKTEGGAFYGITTDQNGLFELKDIKTVGTYTLEVSFMGYSTVTKTINITDASQTIRTGIITLREDAAMLGEVEVMGQASQVRFDIDKKVFNVDAAVAAAGASATDILENIPSVDVDQDGEVSLRNSANVEIWINGRPSGLNEDNRAQILQQMPAGSIQSVEIITNPSAKFNPEGTAGIINIVLKKDREMGYYGSVSAAGSINTNKNPGANASVNFNLNHKVVDFYINAGFNWDKFRNSQLTDRYAFTPGTDPVRSDTLSFLQNQVFGNSKGIGAFARTGLDFHLNDKNTLSLSGTFHVGRRNSESINYYTAVDWATMDTSLYRRISSNDGTRPSYSACLEHTYEIDSIGSEIRTSLEYSYHNNPGDFYYEQYSDVGFMPEYDQIQRRDGRMRSARFKMDYTQKIRDNMKVEAGIYGSWDDRLSPSRTWNIEDGDSLLQQYNDFHYREWIGAAYCTYGARFGGFSFSVGLRGEYTNTRVISNDTEEGGALPIDTSYFKIYPTAFLSYDFGKGHELQANYTRRINRPRGRQLNPFRDLSDSTNVQFGNPYLSPEISSAVELNYIKSWDMHVLSVSAFYRFSDYCMERVRFLDTDRVMNSTFENVAKRQSAGLEIVAKNKFANWVNMTTTLNGYFSNMADVYYDVYGTGDPVLLYPKTNSFSWSARIMLNFLIPYGMSAQLTGQYRSANLVAQGKSVDQYSLDFGFRKSFLNRKLNLALSIRDLLNSRKWANTTWGDNFWQYSAFLPHGTNFKLTLTYNFGTGDNKQKRRSEGGMDDSMGGEEDMMDML